MNISESLKFLPKPAVFLLPITFCFLAFAIFSFFKKKARKDEEEIQAEKALPKKALFDNLLPVLTILLLLLTLPLAVLLIKQSQEIRQRAKGPEEHSLEPTPYEEQSSPPSSFWERIKIYDKNWEEIPYEDLSRLSLGEVVRIAVKSEKEGRYDKGRIRINSMEWTPENETADQTPNSSGEFYIECEVEIAEEKATICGISATPKNEFKIEAEIHNVLTNRWD